VPRVHAELAADGVHVGRKRVARLMRVAGVHGVSRRKPHRTTRRDPGAAPAPDLVSRDFAAGGPDRLWVADITYIPTWVSPSGMRRTRSPISAAMARKTASGLASGTLPTRCTPDATGWATAIMSMTEWARASAQTRTGSRDWVRRAGHPASQIGVSGGSRPRLTASPGPPGPRTGVTYAHDSRARVPEMGETLTQ
jgi:transposase InsO family protein